MISCLDDRQQSPSPSHSPLPSPPYYYAAAYRYKVDLLALANCKQQQPPLLPPFLTSITSPLNLAAWAQELENHPDQEVAQYLLQGMSQGFWIGFNYPRKCQSAKSNVKSAKENPQVIDEYLVKECSLGRILGPLNSTIIPGFHPSRFGVDIRPFVSRRLQCKRWGRPCLPRKELRSTIKFSRKFERRDNISKRSNFL